MRHMSVRLRYGDLVQLIERMHALPASRGIATESRIKNFSRLDFPPGPKVGSGERAEYGPIQVVQLLVGFELLRHRMPPAVIAEVVRTEWPRIAHGFATAARELGRGEERGADAPLLLVDAVALHEVGKTIRPGELLTTIEPVSPSELFGGADQGSAASVRSALVLNPAAILAAAAAQLPWLRRPKDAAAFIAELAATEAG